MISCGLFLVDGFLQNQRSVCVETDPPRGGSICASKAVRSRN